MLWYRRVSYLLSTEGSDIITEQFYFSRRDAFCLFYDSKTKEIKGLNGSGRSPERLTIDHVRKRGIHGSKIPITDLNAVTVPGAAACWIDTIESFGNGKVSRKDIFAPAIRFAENGYANEHMNDNVAG